MLWILIFEDCKLSNALRAGPDIVFMVSVIPKHTFRCCRAINCPLLFHLNPPRYGCIPKLLYESPYGVRTSKFLFKKNFSSRIIHKYFTSSERQRVVTLISSRQRPFSFPLFVNIKYWFTKRPCLKHQLSIESTVPWLFLHTISRPWPKANTATSKA